MNAAVACPKCEAPLPADAPEGLCPGCLMSVGLAGSLASTPSDGRFPVPDLAALRDAFPRFDVQGLIGRGGMGAVYKAKDLELGRTVTLKILPPELAADPVFSERFRSPLCSDGRSRWTMKT